MRLTLNDWITIVGFLVAVEMAIGHGTISLTNALPDSWVPRVQAWCNILAFIGATLITTLSRIAAVVVAIAVLATLALPGAAQAQGAPLTITPRPRPPLTGNPIADIKAALPSSGGDEAVTAAGAGTSAGAVDGAFANFHSQVQKIAKDVVDAAIADLNAAITDADNHKDAISKPCWQAQVNFLTMLPVEWAEPPAKIGIALGIQIQRDLLNQITGNDAGSLKVACAALLGDQLRIIGNTAALIGLKVGSGGLLP